MKDELKLLSTEWKMRIEYDANGNAIYIGEAKAGTELSATGWRIKKITYDANGDAIRVDWADGDMKNDNIWDNRTTYSYS